MACISKVVERGSALLGQQLIYAARQTRSLSTAALSICSRINACRSGFSSPSSQVLSSRISVLENPHQFIRQFRSFFFKKTTPIKDQEVLQFPEKEVIIAYLKRHSSTKDPYLTEKKIIEAVATVFSNKEKNKAGLRLGISLSLYDLKLTTSSMALMLIEQNLFEALKDCANNKPLEMKTTD